MALAAQGLSVKREPRAHSIDSRQPNALRKKSLSLSYGFYRRVFEPCAP
jgi:hypothetical protein